jgi:hypothetical protein
VNLGKKDWRPAAGEGAPVLQSAPLTAEGALPPRSAAWWRAAPDAA